MTISVCQNCSHRSVCYKYRNIESGKKEFGDYFGEDTTCDDFCKSESVEINMFDIIERYDDCTVEVLKNSVTGEVSIGWYKNDCPPFPISH